MLIDVSLILIFFAGLVALWLKLSQKIPELIAVPDQVITARFEEDSAKFRLFIVHLKSYYLEKRYKETLFRILGKALYRIHIIFLRLDNGTVDWLKKIRAKQGVNSGNGNGATSPEILSDKTPEGTQYWKQLKNESSPAPKEVNKIQEIKPR